MWCQSVTLLYTTFLIRENLLYIKSYVIDRHRATPKIGCTL
nr:MAG TPA: hypothetical protein [Caudoviricetes sp.]